LLLGRLIRYSSLGKNWRRLRE